MEKHEVLNATIPMSEAKALGNKVTPRAFRLLKALTRGPVTREEADRIAGASNSPDQIHRLRNRFGLAIRTERVVRIDRDGRPTRIGIYHLESESKQHARLLLMLSLLAKNDNQIVH